MEPSFRHFRSSSDFASARMLDSDWNGHFRHRRLELGIGVLITWFEYTSFSNRALRRGDRHDVNAFEILRSIQATFRCSPEFASDDSVQACAFRPKCREKIRIDWKFPISNPDGEFRNNIRESRAVSSPFQEENDGKTIAIDHSPRVSDEVLVENAITQLSDAEAPLPNISIYYCTGCNWLLRAAYFGQELLTTFSEGEIASITLVPSRPPAKGGRFVSQ